MRLQSISVGGFQSYRDTQVVELDDHLTVVAGRNNVGKSALLRAMRAVAQPPEEVHRDFALSYAWRLDGAALAAALWTTGKPGAPLTERVEAAGELRLEADFRAVSMPARGGPSAPPQIVCSRIALPEIGARSELQPDRKNGWSAGPLEDKVTGVDEITRLAVELAGKIFYAAPRRPEQGRQFFTAKRPELEAAARNLTWVQMWLQSQRPRDVTPAIIEFMRAAFPDIELVNVALADDADVGGQMAGELVVHYRGRPEPVPLRHCGTGVEQMLVLATIVEFADEPRVILLDEPQAYLHPHAETVLLQLLDRHPEHQYVIATHSHLMLRAVPLARARLLTLQDGATRVHAPSEPQAVLDELGVKASDLWLNDRLLWVEGASDLAVLRAMVENEWSRADAAGLAIREMPVAPSRFSGKKESSASTEFRFVEQVIAAVAPLGAEMLFLFDRDGRGAAAIERVERASGGRAVFLAVRELESMFLDARVLTPVLGAHCGEAGLPKPSSSEVQAQLDAVAGDESAARQLDVVFVHFTRSEYVKARDAPTLARAALDVAPELLEPLRAVLARLRR